MKTKFELIDKKFLRITILKNKFKSVCCFRTSDIESVLESIALIKEKIDLERPSKVDSHLEPYIVGLSNVWFDKGVEGIFESLSKENISSHYFPIKYNKKLNVFTLGHEDDFTYHFDNLHLNLEELEDLENQIRDFQFSLEFEDFFGSDF